jgi:acyl carrier protein
MMRDRQDISYTVASLLRDVMRPSGEGGESGVDGAVFPLPAIRGDSDIAQDLGLDSIAVLEFVCALEETFDLNVPLNEVAHIKTVDAVVDRVVAHLAASASDGAHA